VALLGCARSFPESTNLFAETPHDPWSEPLTLEWQAALTEGTPFEYKPIERGGVALNDSRDRVYVGTRVGTLWCLRALDGREVWRREMGAGIGSTPVYHEGTLYVGTEGGELVALNPETGQILWRFASKGLVSMPPAITEDALFFADSRNTVWSLQPFKGTYGWHYSRDVPEGFSVTGYAAPRVFGELLVAGFSDGKLVGMSASDGSIIWEVDLGGTAKFRDVDATPIMAGGRLITASYAKGVYAIDPHEGTIEWHHAVEGATAIDLEKSIVRYG
jgi:outer membrane protein assembly factor BamB